MSEGRLQALWVVLAPLLLCCGSCVNVPEFADPGLIDRPRVLAVVAEPPEVAPGEPVKLKLLFAGASDYTVRWTACGVFSSSGVGGGTQYGDQPAERGCGGPFSVPLGEGTEAVLPGAASAALFENLDLASEVLGSLLPGAAIEDIKGSVGLPLLVEATVETEGRVLRAIKRVLISERDRPHSNPPPPHFMFGEDLEVVATEDDPMVCATSDGTMPAFRPGQRVELAPVVEGEEEPWLETYQVLDARGELSERSEKAFYSWFATGGSFAEQITESPLRNDVWTTPPVSGEHSLFLVVRDGHGGISACRLSVRGS